MACCVVLHICITLPGVWRNRAEPRRSSRAQGCQLVNLQHNNRKHPARTKQTQMVLNPSSAVSTFPSSPRYELDMAKPYDYMVARMLLAMANKSEGLEFTNVEHASGEVGWGNRRIYVFPTCSALTVRNRLLLVIVCRRGVVNVFAAPRQTKVCVRPMCIPQSSFLVAAAQPGGGAHGRFPEFWRVSWACGLAIFCVAIAGAPRPTPSESWSQG